MLHVCVISTTEPFLKRFFVGKERTLVLHSSVQHIFHFVQGKIKTEKIFGSVSILCILAECLFGGILRQKLFHGFIYSRFDFFALKNLDANTVLGTCLQERVIFLDGVPNELFQLGAVLLGGGGVIPNGAVFVVAVTVLVIQIHLVGHGYKAQLLVGDFVVARGGNHFFISRICAGAK